MQPPALAIEYVPLSLDLDPVSSRLYNLADNKLASISEWDQGPLAEMLRELSAEDAVGLAIAGFGAEDIAKILAEAGPGGDPAAAEATLAERFGVPPFSVLDARQGYWQQRKQAWLAMGIESELGRGGGMTWNVHTDGKPTTPRDPKAGPSNG